jgi:hypothetical protein
MTILKRWRQPVARREGRKVYWKVPFWLRVGCWGGAAAYGTSSALRHLGLGEPQLVSLAEWTRLLTFGTVAGVVTGVNIYVERRRKLGSTSPGP